MFLDEKGYLNQLPFADENVMEKLGERQEELKSVNRGDGFKEILSDENFKEFEVISERKAPPVGEGERASVEDVAEIIGNHDYVYTPDSPEDAEKGVVFAGPTVQQVGELFPELIVKGEDGLERIDTSRAALVALGLIGQLAREIVAIKDSK